MINNTRVNTSFYIFFILLFLEPTKQDEIVITTNSRPTAGAVVAMHFPAARTREMLVPSTNNYA